MLPHRAAANRQLEAAMLASLPRSTPGKDTLMPDTLDFSWVDNLPAVPPEIVQKAAAVVSISRDIEHRQRHRTAVAQDLREAIKAHYTRAQINAAQACGD